MKKFLPISALLASALPFALKLPYCLQAMKSSPAERMNWCFLVGALLLAALSLPKIIEGDFPKHSFAPLKLLALLPPALLIIFGFVKNIHLAALLGGALLPCSAIYCIYGWRELFLLFPAFGMLILSIPNIGLLASSVLELDGLLIKLVIALLLVSSIPFFYILKSPIPKPATALFCLLALLVVIAYLAGGHYSNSMRPPLMPEFDKLILNEFRGIQQGDSSIFRNFYGDSDIRRFIFSDKNNNIINILQVSKIQNIHNVHPTTFCIRVSGYDIVSEHTLHIPQTEQHPAFDVQEIVAEKNSGRHIFWQWYSTPEKSTASFLLFRTLYSSNGNWTAFIADAPVNTSIEHTQELLKSLIQSTAK